MTAPHRPRSRSSLGKDLAVFADPGFLVTVAILLALFAIGAVVLLAASEKYGVPALRLSAKASSAVV